MNIDLEYVVINMANDLGLDNKTLVYVLSRLKNEGISFLTCVLPQLSKAVLKGLESGKLSMPSCFANEKWCFSRYFRVWLLKIFHNDGTVRSNPSEDAIKKLRQFCDYFYKLAVKHSLKQEKEAVQKYVATESEVSNFVANPAWIEEMRKTFHSLFPKLVSSTCIDFLNTHKPRYTSGSFYESDFLKIPYYLYKHMPDFITGTCHKEHKAVAGYLRSAVFRLNRIFVKDGAFRTKVLFVPKDSRGPRVISKEPLNLLKLQMSYFDNMVEILESTTNHRINFRDQEVNRELARQSSLDMQRSTLDLKEASDRVSYSIARRVFRDSPALSWFFDKARSTNAIVGGKSLPLAKLAGMGSGLTFPTMALVIYISVVTSVAKSLGIPYKTAADEIYVYGDDLIVPTKWYTLSVKGLEASGLSVNEEKSFHRSRFRESCGGDFYNGVNVTPVRLKLSNAGLTSKSFRRKPVRTVNCLTNKPHRYVSTFMNLSNDQGLYQLDRHCRELVRAGMLSLANYYYSRLEQHFGSDYGYCSGDSPCLGRYTVEPIYINDDLRHYRWIPTTVVVESDGLCVFKAIASSIKGAGNETSNTLPFGSLAKPRAINLRKMLVPSILLR